MLVDVLRREVVAAHCGGFLVELVLTLSCYLLIAYSIVA